MVPVMRLMVRTIAGSASIARPRLVAPIIPPVTIPSQTLAGRGTISRPALAGQISAQTIYGEGMIARPVLDVMQATLAAMTIYGEGAIPQPTLDVGMVPGTTLDSQALESIGTISQPRIIFRSVLPVRLNADPIIGNASIGRPRLFVQGLPPEPEPEVDMRDRYADRIISTDDTVDLLITQYQVNSNMRGLDEQIQKVIQRNLVEPLAALEDMRNISTLRWAHGLTTLARSWIAHVRQERWRGRCSDLQGSGNASWESTNARSLQCIRNFPCVCQLPMFTTGQY